MLIPRPLSRALRRPALRVTAAAAALLLAGTGAAAVAGPAAAQDTAVINGATTYQTMTGFGASEAFGEAQTVMNASASVQQQALSLLYSPTSGAGLTMLRNEISADSGSTIEPTAPASPAAAPAYVPLASISQDAGQLWFAQQIKADYGVTNVFADAWSAPPFMKTNDSADNGGAVCGLSGATCSSGDWRQAYANYLVQYAKDYAAAGDPLTYIGPENEANLSTSYDSMQLSPAQTASFLDVLGPTLASSGLSTKMECCATEGWDYAQQYASAIEADPTASADTAVFTSHGYTQAPASALTGWTRPAWQTEWSTFETWDPAWDDGTGASGLTWAQHIYTGLTAASLSAFLYWWGSTTPSENGDNEGLIQINGSTVAPSGRLWAFANYSPVRPARRGPDRRDQLEQRGRPDRVQEPRRLGGRGRAEHRGQRRPHHLLAVRHRHPGRGDGHAVPDQRLQRHRRPGDHHGQRRRVQRDHPGPVAGHLRHPGQPGRRRRHADAHPHAHGVAHSHSHAHPDAEHHPWQRQLPGHLQHPEPVGGRVRGQRHHRQPGPRRDQRLDAGLHLPRRPEDHQRLERVGHPERGERVHHQRQLQRDHRREVLGVARLPGHLDQQRRGPHRLQPERHAM